MRRLEHGLEHLPSIVANSPFDSLEGRPGQDGDHHEEGDLQANGPRPDARRLHLVAPWTTHPSLGAFLRRSHQTENLSNGVLAWEPRTF